MVRKQAGDARRLEAGMIAYFEGETKEMRTRMETLPKNSLLRRFIGQEVDLRERRAKQWKDNPSGLVEEPFKEIKDYTGL